MLNFRDDGIAAVIPARAGSKRIPNKNFREIDGQPAVARIIDKLVSTNLFDKIIVSTDLKKIPNTLKKYKDYFHLRAGNLSDDHTSLVEVMAFEANRLASMGSYKHVLCVLPTAFAFSQEEILQSLNSLIANRKAVYTTCIKKFETNIERALIKRESGDLKMKVPENFFKRSQDCEKLYHDVGQFYWGKSTAWQSSTPFFSDDNTLGFELASRFVFDIDEPNDWIMAEQLFECGLWR